MSDDTEQTDALKRHIIAHFDDSEAQWNRLKAYARDTATVSEEERAEVKALQKQKPFLRRRPRRALARFRRKYRKSYRKAADKMVKGWRPNYESRLAKARPYQEDISRITRHEIRNMENTHGILKKITGICEDIKKRLKR